MRPPQDRVTGPPMDLSRWGRGGCLGILGAGLLLALAVFGIAGWNTVDSGKVAVTRSFGRIEGVRGAGGFWAQPVGFSMVDYDLRVVKKLEGQQAALRNQQTLFVNSVAYQYNLTPDAAQELLNKIGTQQTFEDLVVIPKLQNAIKIVTPKYTANEVFPKRAQMEQEMERSLSADLEEYNIAPGSVDITLSDIDFDPEFRKSIDAKAKAEQERLVEEANLEKQKIRNDQELQQARTDALKAETAAKGESLALQARASGEAQATRLRASAEAQANKEIAASLKPELIAYRYAQNWNGQLPSTMLGQGGNVFTTLPGATTPATGTSTSGATPAGSNGQAAGPKKP